MRCNQVSLLDFLPSGNIFELLVNILPRLQNGNEPRWAMGKGLRTLEFSFEDTDLTHFGELVLMQRFCQCCVCDGCCNET